MEIRLPELSEGSSDAVLTSWHAAESDHVTEGQDLVEIATDKATFDMPVPCSGELVKILKREGEKVAVNEIIAEIQEDVG